MTPAERFARSKPKRPAQRKPPTWVCRLNEYRTKLGLTCRDVEEATGVSNATVIQLEQGQDPRLTTARKLATFFGVTVEEMWPTTSQA